MRDERSHLRRASLAALIALSISAGTAAAQSCGGESDRLARQYDLSADAPRAGTTEAPAAPGTPPSGGATATESRAQSSGVLSPPDAATTAIGEGGQLPAAERQRMAQLLQRAEACARRRPFRASPERSDGAVARRRPRTEGVSMKAVVFHDVGDIRLEDVPEPKLQEPTDAIVRRHLRHRSAHGARHAAGHEGR